MTVTFNNSASNNEPVELGVAGNWIDRHCTISLNNVPVAQITRDFFNARQILGDADTVRLPVLNSVLTSLGTVV
jgi:hypothetical protein